MRYLVVGGAGFIGSTLVDRLLAEGQAVDAIDDLSTGSLANLADARADRNYDFTFHRLDATEPVTADVLARRRPDVLYHLGLSLVPNEESAGALRRLLGGALAAGVSKVIVGLDARLLYDRPDAGEHQMGEGRAGRNPTPEGRATRALIEALSHARIEQDLEFTALALGTVYGPRQPRGAVVARLMRHALARPVTDAAVAAGSHPGRSDDSARSDDATDLVFVDDAVDAFDRAATRGNGLVINVGTGILTSIEDVRVTATAVAASSMYDRTERPILQPDGVGGGARLTRFALDPARAGIQLGWAPWTTVTEGVAATMSWEIALARGV